MCAHQQNMTGNIKRSLLLSARYLGHCFHPAAAPLTWVEAGHMQYCQISAALPHKPASEADSFFHIPVKKGGLVVRAGQGRESCRTEGLEWWHGRTRTASYLGLTMDWDQ